MVLSRHLDLKSFLLLAVIIATNAALANEEVEETSLMNN